MPDLEIKSSILSLKIKLDPNHHADFVIWQSRLNEEITKFPGFLSLEIISPTEKNLGEWVIIERFRDYSDADVWLKSKIKADLTVALHSILDHDHLSFIKEEELSIANLKGITEVFVTQVKPENVNAYRSWLAKIHQAEAKFPGFKGMYVQAPSDQKSINWITFLQFDSTDHLDHWLASAERREILREAKGLISSMESHRMISPYAGWFSSIGRKEGIPPAWKQTMMVLLVLFPIVMLEFKFLSPLTKSLNLSLGTFIGNAISVSLVSWPLMPFAIQRLAWWLSPSVKDGKFGSNTNTIGLFIVLTLYLIEIAIFWFWFK